MGWHMAKQIGAYLLLLVCTFNLRGVEGNPPAEIIWLCHLHVYFTWGQHSLTGCFSWLKISISNDTEKQQFGELTSVYEWVCVRGLCTFPYLEAWNWADARAWKGCRGWEMSSAACVAIKWSKLWGGFSSCVFNLIVTSWTRCKEEVMEIRSRSAGCWAGSCLTAAHSVW